MVYTRSLDYLCCRNGIYFFIRKLSLGPVAIIEKTHRGGSRHYQKCKFFRYQKTDLWYCRPATQSLGLHERLPYGRNRNQYMRIALIPDTRTP